MTDLKPCPFCGSKNVNAEVFKETESYDAFVECDECDARGPLEIRFWIGVEGTKEEREQAIAAAIEAWNKRAEEK